jgi:hypothetical protein
MRLLLALLVAVSVSAEPREDAIREIAVRMGSRERATWTLRTAERDAAFEVAFASGYEDGLLLRMRGDRVVEILTIGEGTRTKAAAVPPHSKWPLLAAVGLAIPRSRVSCARDGVGDHRLSRACAENGIARIRRVTRRMRARRMSARGVFATEVSDARTALVGQHALCMARDPASSRGIN